MTGFPEGILEGALVLLAVVLSYVIGHSRRRLRLRRCHRVKLCPKHGIMPNDLALCPSCDELLETVLMARVGHTKARFRASRPNPTRRSRDNV